jgi:hypothetical protein
MAICARAIGLAEGHQPVGLERDREIGGKIGPA